MKKSTRFDLILWTIVFILIYIVVTVVVATLGYVITPMILLLLFIPMFGFLVFHIDKLRD